MPGVCVGVHGGWHAFPVDEVGRDDVVPVVLAALVEDVPHATPLEDAVHVVDVLKLQPTRERRVHGDAADDVEDWDQWVEPKGLAGEGQHRGHCAAERAGLGAVQCCAVCTCGVAVSGCVRVIVY